jgi:hypothetical protein
MRMTPAPLPMASVVYALGQELRSNGREVRGETWLGMQAPAPMLEVLESSFRAPMSSNPDHLVRDLRPNLPWADLHFEERVGRRPTNPGDTYHLWPFYPKGTARDEQIRKDERGFTHTYQERIWPKKAIPTEADRELYGDDLICMKGIRYHYGDLDDVVRLLRRDPLTRQAFLPIWFPEDTGAVHGGRVPCTLGYWFVQREGYLHCTYYIRAVDYFRHLRDDIYLAARLNHWVLDQLVNEGSERWANVKVGFLNMHIGSLHCWAQERELLPK